MAVSYPADGNALLFQLEDESFWFRHRNRCVIEAVRQFPPVGHILDVGGGNGFVARGLIDAGFRTVLLEPGADGASNARTHRKIPDVINSTLEDANLPSGSVPAVGLFDVLEHIEDDQGFVTQIAGLLQPSGLVFVTVPAHQWLWCAADVHAGHFRRYSLKQLRARFAAAGFDVEYATCFFEPVIVPFFLLRTVPFVLGWSTAAAAEATYEQEHRAGRGAAATILDAMLSREVAAIARRRTIMTGTSCLLVARKVR